MKQASSENLARRICFYRVVLTTMSFIELFEGGRSRGKFTLPPEVTGVSGGVFRLQRAVKGGGNGMVFESRPFGLKKADVSKCAVKVLKQQDDTRLDRFENEIRIIRLLDHPKIAAYYDSGVIDMGSGYKVPWMAMELGEDNLRTDVQTDGPLPKNQLLSVAMDICDALSHLHSKRIVHRDVKPDNFVWFGDHIRMIDFGIAKLIGEDVSARPLDQFTKDQEFVGPVFFSSPELIAYAEDKTHVVDHRSDLFQFGKVLWFIATGKISAGIPSLRQCPFGGELHRLVAALLCDDPQDRPADAATVRAELLKIG